MNHNLQPGQSISLTIFAREEYSREKLAIEKNQKYEFSCDVNQEWKDWFKTTSPQGFFNLLASLYGLRVNGVKCFCLCGCYNENDSTAFAIGSGKTVTTAESGTLSFFANDSPGFYKNNSGSVVLQIKRLS